MASIQALGREPKGSSSKRCEVAPERIEQILRDLRREIRDEHELARLYAAPVARAA